MTLRRLLLTSLRRASIPTSTRSTFTSAFTSPEEAAAARRRRARVLRISPNSSLNSSTAPRLPDTTSALTGPRLNLHNRVQSLLRAGDLDNASVLARQSVYSFPRPTVFTCNSVISSMLRAKRYNDAIAHFHFFFKQSNIVPNIVSYNLLISAHCECGDVGKALGVYRMIIEEAPFSPSAVTYRHLTEGLIESGQIGDAVDLLREMGHRGLGADSLVYDNLIKGYLSLGDLGKAKELFDELKERCVVYDGVVTSSFMDSFFSNGRGKEAMEYYRSLLDCGFKMSPATCNVLLRVLLLHGKKKEAWDLFDSMLDNHTPPNFQAVNSESFNIMVNECFKEGKFMEAVNTFRKVGIKVASKPFAMDVNGYNNMIVRFCEHGMISEAEKFFWELQSKSLSPDITGYRTLIDAYLKEKRIDDAAEMFNKTVNANLRVIPLYADRWLNELIQNEKAIEASQILTKMGEKDPKPDPNTYEIVIKGLCSIDALDAAIDMVDQVMKYGVGVTPSLHEFLCETFGKVGRKDEIERVLNEKRIAENWRNSGSSQPSGPLISAGPARIHGLAEYPRVSTSQPGLRSKPFGQQNSFPAT